MPTARPALTTGVRFVFLPVTLLCLVACGPLTIRNAETGHYIALSQPVLVLHREVVVPPQRTRVFFQAGEPLSGVNEFQPHCELAVRELVDRPQVIQADRFTVTRVSSMTEYVVDAGGVLLALHGDAHLADGDGGGDGESPLMKLYIMWLHSERQPQVQTLICGGAFDSPALAVRPTLQDIATALGDYATFTPQ
jgi:hypothetical protein